MLKKSRRSAEVLRVVLTVALGTAVYAAACLLSARLILNGTLPEEGRKAAAICSAAAAGLVSGIAARGKGRRGLLIGFGMMLVYIVFRACTASDIDFNETACLTAGIMLIVPWAGSCIFHKKANDYTKRNRAMVRRR